MPTKLYVSRVYEVNQTQLNQYASVSGGTARIHTDPEYAKQTPFGGTIVHGLLLVVLIENELQHHFNDWFSKGHLEITFIKPIKAGEKFVICFEDVEHGFMISIKKDEEIMATGNANKLS